MKTESRKPKRQSCAAMSLRIGAALSLAALLSACAFTDRPIVNGNTGLRAGWHRPQLVHQPDGTSVTFKRYERTASRNFFHHAFRQIYSAPGEHFIGDGVDQETILTEWGVPDYVRKPFKSLEGERVHEWVYLDEYRIFQFVKGELVYDGPLTDFEQTLMRLGYPDRMVTLVDDLGRVIHTLNYRAVLFPYRLDTLYFSNDVLVHSARGS